jgi:hypothetical protein
MASLGQTFDASNVEPMSGYEVYPPGKYLTQITHSEMRVTKDGGGQFLYLELDILEGQYAGRKLFDRLNLINANSETVQIAQRTLSSICRAVGKLQVSNSEQLHLIPLIADVRVRPPKGQYGESNSMRYLPRNADAGHAAFMANNAPAQPVSNSQATSQPAMQTTSQPAFVAQAQPHAPAANGMPWKRQA